MIQYSKALGAPPPPGNYLFRVGDGNNFWNSSHLCKWGTKNKKGFNDINKGDLMWFITANSSGKIIAVATFDGMNKRDGGGLTDEELGWSGDRYDYEIDYKELYDVTHLNLLTNIKQRNSVSKPTETCEVDLAHEYPLIVRYSRAVYVPGGECVAWRVVMDL